MTNDKLINNPHPLIPSPTGRGGTNESLSLLKKLGEGFVILILGFSASDLSFAQMDHSMMNMSPEEHAKMMMKMNEVGVSTEKQQLIGVKIETAKREGLSKTIKTVGAVAFDPDLYSAQTEYSQAVQAFKKAEESGDQDIINNAKELVSAAELKLEFLGISRGMMEKIAKSDDSLLVGSKDGAVWVYSKIYEHEMPLVKEGMTIHVTSKNLPGEMFMGKIASIDPVIDQVTRSVRVRALVQNRKGMLKPNMFVNASIEIPLRAEIVIPEDAVMDTGENQIVYVEKKKGIFEKRDVLVGQRSKGMIEILSGLKEGERVVTSGTFLIDSESKLKSTGGGHQH